MAAASEVCRRALAPIVAGEGDTLMIWAWDRYSRDGIEGAFRELCHLEDHLGACLWSLQEPFLSTAAPRDQRELLLSIVAWAARWESSAVPPSVRFKRAWELADEMLIASGPQLPHSWIVADDEYGRPSVFRDRLGRPQRAIRPGGGADGCSLLRQ